MLEEREKMPLIVATSFCLQRPRAANAFRLDPFVFLGIFLQFRESVLVTPVTMHRNRPDRFSTIASFRFGSAAFAFFLI